MRAYQTQNGNEFGTVMEEMITLINDGHGRVSNFKNRVTFYYPPFAADFAEGVLLVSRLFEEKTGLLEGDIIDEIDGRQVSEIISEKEKLISSATPQWRSGILKQLLLRKAKNTVMMLKIKRGNEILVRDVMRNFTFEKLREKVNYPEYRPEKIKKLKDGIYYVDLERSSMKEINDVMDSLASAKGVVFDLRGYPNSTDPVLCHLTDVPITSARWNVPQIIYPDRENIVGYDTSGRWNIEPLEPKLNGKIIFLTNGGAISYAESVMGIVEAYKLGTIVGETTAGTNGNVNPINLLGGYVVYFTGMKVMKHDGSQHHGIGIKPDVPVSRTIKGIKEKRDEFLEKAIEIIEGN
jgi:C-terminal processing protease CtpA/Prc